MKNNPEIHALVKMEESLEVEVELDLEAYFKHGLHEIRCLNFTAAIEIFENIIENYPKVLEAYINLGTAYFKSGKIKESIEIWKKALSMDSGLVNCYVNIGNAYKALGNSNEAISNWQSALMIAPDHSSAPINLAVSFEEQGNISFAMRFYELFLKYNENRINQRIKAKVKQQKRIALLNLKVGIKYQKINELRKAAQAYLKSIEAYPALAKSQLNMGSICYIAEKYENAVHYWLNSYKLESDFENTTGNLGVAYDKLKKYTYAYCFYVRYLEKAGGEENFKEGARIKKRLKQLNDYIEIRPEIIEAHFKKAEELKKQMKYEDALIEYENYKILKPSASENADKKINEIKDFIYPEKKAAKTALDIGNSCLKKKKISEADVAYRRCIRLDSDGEYGLVAKQKLKECAKLGASFSKTASNLFCS